MCRDGFFSEKNDVKPGMLSLVLCVFRVNFESVVLVFP